MWWFRILLAFAASAILAAQTDPCLIRGRVTDTSSAAIGTALIHIFAKDSMSLVYRGNADYYDGSFCLEDLAPGTYTVKAWQRGFRANRVHDVVVRGGETVDDGTIQLEVVGCDAREVMCCLRVATPEVAAAQPDEPIEIARTDLNLPQACGIDLDQGKVICPRSKGPAKDMDVVFLEEHGALFLRPVNGAQIQPDCKGAYRGEAMRVEGLGKGDDLCAKTRTGFDSHLFFEGDGIEPNTTKLSIWIVTKK